MSDQHALFVHQTNISHFEKILKTETDPGEIQRIQWLLAKEKQRLSQYLNDLASRLDAKRL